MPTNDQDARALTYLARRLRAETNGANDWDEAGVWAVVSRLQGQQLAMVVERVTRHAADPDAKTPGAINRPFTPAATGEPTPTPPRLDQACRLCGRHTTACLCDQPTTRPIAAVPPTSEFQAERQALRSADR